MVFSGRAMMYGVAALGEVGAEHAIELLREELSQVMEQLGCKTPNSMVDHSASQGF
jgi:L-lactate dehydrogenase (cytochrome)